MPKSKRHPARRPQPRPARRPHPAGPQRSAASKATTAQPQATGFRRTLEVRSAPLLLTLHRLPKWLVPLLLALFLVAGLIIPAPVAGILLLVVAAFLGWLLALSWPLVSRPGRALRLAAVVALVVVGVLRMAGVFQ